MSQRFDSRVRRSSWLYTWPKFVFILVPPSCSPYRFQTFGSGVFAKAKIGISGRKSIGKVLFIWMAYQFRVLRFKGSFRKSLVYKTICGTGMEAGSITVYANYDSWQGFWNFIWVHNSNINYIPYLPNLSQFLPKYITKKVQSVTDYGRSKNAVCECIKFFVDKWEL